MAAAKGSPLSYRLLQAQISARLVQQIVAARRALANPAKIDASWPALRSILASTILQARTESAQLARSAYLQAREDAGIPDGLYVPPEPPALEMSRLEAALDVTGPVEFKRAIAAGKTEQQAIDASAVRMSGSASYLALEGGRDVMQGSISHDPRASGYSRVTDSKPCAWCAMLASRGPVYKTAQSAGDPRQGGSRYHDHCSCQAWPAFTMDEPFIGHAENLYEDWRRVTRGTGGNDAVNAFRRWWQSEGSDAYTSPRSTLAPGDTP